MKANYLNEKMSYLIADNLSQSAPNWKLWFNPSSAPCWEGKREESHSGLRYREFNRESKSHVDKQSKTKQRIHCQQEGSAILRTAGMSPRAVGSDGISTPSLCPAAGRSRKHPGTASPAHKNTPVLLCLQHKHKTQPCTCSCGKKISSTPAKVMPRSVPCGPPGSVNVISTSETGCIAVMKSIYSLQLQCAVETWQKSKTNKS